MSRLAELGTRGDVGSLGERGGLPVGMTVSDTGGGGGSGELIGRGKANPLYSTGELDAYEVGDDEAEEGDPESTEEPADENEPGEEIGGSAK